MKTRSITAALAAIALTSSTAVFAAVDNTQNANAQWLVDASKLEGTAVYDFHGHKLGDLQQVLIDPQTGRIRYGVMEVDKSWSWPDPQVAIPWDSFAVKRGDDKKAALSIDATKQKLENAPKFKAGDADRLFSREASQPIYSYWSIFWYEDPAASMKSNSDSSASSKEEPNTSNKTDENASKAGPPGTTSSATKSNSNTSANADTNSSSTTTESNSNTSATNSANPSANGSSSNTNSNSTDANNSSATTPASNNRTDPTKN